MNSAVMTARGSKLQVQTYVNRRPGALGAAVRDALPTLSETAPAVAWVAPLEHQAYREPQDAEFLRAVGRGDLAESLASFWPRGGPVWDALGLAVFPERRPGVVLIEGKSYPGEMTSSCQATEPSRTKIARAVEATQRWLSVEPDAERWMTSVYQSANRLAHLYWLREVAGVDAWLVHVLFTDDMTHGRGCSREEWERELPALEASLGVGPNPYVGKVFLPALAGSELSRSPEAAQQTS